MTIIIEPLYTIEELLKKIKYVKSILLKTQDEVQQSKSSDESYTPRYIWCEYELTRYIVTNFFNEKEVLRESLGALTDEYNHFRSVVSEYFDYQYIEDGRDAVTFIITDFFLKINPQTVSDYQRLANILSDLNNKYIRNKEGNNTQEVTWKEMLDYVNDYLDYQNYLTMVYEYQSKLG